ncbi:hypothetical protein DL93DRAFT_2092211 [Clavulina sp. PMI_390]|nr:hypothetical protein DL93DRAFT_2092211 [Clavulina sp. PMI_390]
MHDRYNRGGDYIIGSATPIPLRQLLERRGNLTELGQSIVKLQLSLHAEALSQAEARTTSAQASLTEQTASTILESLTGSEEDLAAISALPTALVRKMLSGSEVWASLPYFVFRKLRLLDTSRGDGKPGPVGPGLEQDIDQWILANERTLRDDKRDDWRRGIIDYASHANIVFDTSPESSASALVIHRGVLSGYTILDERRASTLSIQPSFLSFQAMFAKITNGLLNGLDWSNVFIAGGIVLSALLCTTDADIEKYSSSDIDIYIHGLDPVAANKKVENIFEIWKSNLPESCREKTLVVRNSRTITFFSEYPVKRVQIVLKLVQNPKEVLLNFDLDVCAMGYDGESLVMLPRAARALETGYSVFTMDLVQGHYLGDRRASQESR